MHEYYGSAEAAFSLDELRTWQSAAVAPFSDVVLDERHVDKLARSRAYTIALAPALVYWNSTLLHMLRDTDSTQSFEWLAVGSWWVWVTEADLAVRTALSSTSRGAQDMVAEAGAKVATAVVRRKGGWNNTRKPAVTPAGEGEEESSPAAPASTLRKIGENLREVPCTLEDVAWSSELSDRDRSSLGRFLRFVNNSQNPEQSTGSDARLLAENAETPLATFVDNNYQLSPATIASLHSLTLLPIPPENTRLADAVPRLAMHVSSLGHIADIRSAAALTIAYGGSAELCQVWSRAAAVAGGINILGRGIKSVSTSDSARKLSAELTTGETVHADYIIRSPEDTDHDNNGEEAAGTTGPSVTKGAFVVSSQLEPLFTSKYTDDRVAPTVAVVTFPVGSLSVDGVSNSSPVYVTAHSAGTECPRDQTLLYTLTAAPQSAGYALVEAAVSRVLESCGNSKSPSTYFTDSRTTAANERPTEEAEILLALRYTQHTPATTPANRREGELWLRPLDAGVAFDGTAVDECRRVYEQVVGTAEGFMHLPERLKMQMQDE